jgi:hypothetical protein
MGGSRRPSGKEISMAPAKCRQGKPRKCGRDDKKQRRGGGGCRDVERRVACGAWRGVGEEGRSGIIAKEMAALKV